MTAPPQVIDLVERFARNLDVYKRAEYKEAHVRVEFIKPFFEALSWDVRNVQGHAFIRFHPGRQETLPAPNRSHRPPDRCLGL